MAKEKSKKMPDKKKKKPTATSGRKSDRKRSENKVGRKQKPG